MNSKSTVSFADTNYLLDCDWSQWMDQNVTCLGLKVSEKVIEKSYSCSTKIICTDEAQLPNYGNGGRIIL